MDAKQVWRAALGELQVSLSPANFETWLRDTQLVDVDDQRFRIAVPNGFAKDWLETRYRSLISQTLARVVGYSVQVEFVVAAGEEAPGQAAAVAAQPVRVEPTRVGAPEGAGGGRHQPQPALHLLQLHRRVGQPPGPRGLAVGRPSGPGHAYNPLFLYGGVGLGKTHLMHAIGNAVAAKFPRKRVVYATSEKFTNEFITSIQQGRIDDFRARYRRIDLLLIDDIQFIADKERTQEEFFHTFNAIHEDGKQIVLSSDRPPKAILTLEERLRSRFEWGLIADLTAPDLETRIAILRAKAEEQGTPITSDVIEFIARKVVSNIRELEGALNRIVAYASMGAMPISIELAQAVLSNVLYNPKKRQVTPERIAQAVSDYYGVGDGRAPGPEAREEHRGAAPDRDVPDARGDGRLAAAHRRGAGRPGPLHGPPRLRQDQPRDAGQRRAAPRDRGRPGADLLASDPGRPRPAARVPRPLRWPRPQPCCGHRPPAPAVAPGTRPDRSTTRGTTAAGVDERAAGRGSTRWHRTGRPGPGRVWRRLGRAPRSIRPRSSPRSVPGRFHRRSTGTVLVRPTPGARPRSSRNAASPKSTA